jgi:SAM-dependent methyltransferase
MLGPNYITLHALAREVRRHLRHRAGLTLDLGADESPYRAFVPNGRPYFRLDVSPGCDPDLVADVVRLPIRSQTVDLVICTQVAEFTEDPRALVAECRRVLKPGGSLVLSVPFLWQNQPTPRDNYRFTMNSTRRLLGAFDDVEIRACGNSWATLAQLAARCVYSATGALGIPAYFIINIAGLVLDSLPLDDSMTTAYVARAVKPAGPPQSLDRQWV